MPDTDYAWLRTDPSAVPRKMPPATFEGLLTGEEVWQRLFVEWLSGDTNGESNATRVDPNADVTEMLRRFGAMRGAGASTGGGLNQVRLAQLAKAYPLFCGEVRSVRRQVDQLAERIKEAAKAKGEKAPSTKDALKQAGRSAQRAGMLNAISGQKAVLDVNVGLILALQIENYKVTALESYNTALNDIADTPWDQDELSEEGGKAEDGYRSQGFKIDAENVMTKAGIAVLNAAAATKAAADAVAAVPAGEPVGEEKYNTLMDSFLDFANAVSAQGEAMTKAANYIEAWAQEATKHTLTKNFDTVYPKLGGALLAIRTTVTIGGAVLSFFPAYSAIGSGLSAVDGAAESAIKWLVVWKDKQDKDTQLKFVGQVFVHDKTKGRAAEVVHAVKKANEALEEGLVNYTTGKAAKALADGAGAVGRKVVDLFGAPEHIKSEGEEFVRDATLMLANQENWQTALDGAASAHILDDKIPVSVEGLEHKLLETGAEKLMDAAGLSAATVAKAAPIAGAVLAAKTVVMDIVAFADAQNMVLVRQAGLTEEDVLMLRAFITDNSAKDPLHSMFRTGELTILPRQPGATGPIEVRMGGIRMAVDVVNKRVVNTDPAVISKHIRAFAKSAAGPIITAPYPYSIDWASWSMTAMNQPLFEATVMGTTTITGRAYHATLALTYDAMREMVTVRNVVPNGDAPPVWQPTQDVLKNRVSGRALDVYGYKLTMGEDVSAFTVADGVATFTVSATIPHHPQPYRLTLEYSAEDGPVVIGLDPDPEVVELTRTRTEEDILAVLKDSGYRVDHQGMSILLDRTLLNSRGTGQSTDFQMKGTIANHPGEYTVDVSLSHTTGALTVLGTDPDAVAAQAHTVVTSDNLVSLLKDMEFQYGLVKLIATDQILHQVTDEQTHTRFIRVTATVRAHPDPYTLDLTYSDDNGLEVVGVTPDADAFERQRRAARMALVHTGRVNLNALTGQLNP